MFLRFTLYILCRALRIQITRKRQALLYDLLLPCTRVLTPTRCHEILGKCSGILSLYIIEYFGFVCVIEVECSFLFECSTLEDTFIRYRSREISGKLPRFKRKSTSTHWRRYCIKKNLRQSHVIFIICSIFQVSIIKDQWLLPLTLTNFNPSLTQWLFISNILREERNDYLN